MSRIFRRPMFRKGGNVGEGIMTGIVDRSNHAIDGGPVMNGDADKTPVNFEQQYIDKITAAGAGSQGMDPLTAYLLAAGPAISSGTSLSDTVGKLADPNKQLIELMNKRASDERNLKVGAAQFGLEKSFDKSQTESDRKFKERMLDKELDFKKQSELDENSIDKIIENQALKASIENNTNLVDEEKKLTWQLKTTKNLQKQGKIIGGILSKKNLKNESSFAKTQIKKGNIGYVFYDSNSDRILEVGKIDGEPALIEIQKEGSVKPVETNMPVIKKEIKKETNPSYMRPAKPDVVTPFIKNYMEDVEEQEGLFGTGA